MFTFGVYREIDKLYFNVYNYSEVKIKKMEQVESIPFSGLISGMLLRNRKVTSIEVVNMMSYLEEMGIMVETQNDDLDQLSCCVEISSKCDFEIRKGLDYETVLYSGVTVSQYLLMYTKEEVLSLIYNDWKYELLGSEIVDSGVEVDMKKNSSFRGKKKTLTRKPKNIEDNLFSRMFKGRTRGTILG